MGKCKDCKSWNPSTAGIYPGKSFGKCRKLKLVCAVGELEDPTCIYLEGTDSQDWPVAIHFGANFGCIHFERREK